MHAAAGLRAPAHVKRQLKEFDEATAGLADRMGHQLCKGSYENMLTDRMGYQQNCSPSEWASNKVIKNAHLQDGLVGAVAKVHVPQLNVVALGAARRQRPRICGR